MTLLSVDPLSYWVSVAGLAALIVIALGINLLLDWWERYDR